MERKIEESAMKKLGELISFELPAYVEGMSVGDVCDNSRAVSSGSMFVALSGAMADGKIYINDAIERGAKCIVLDSVNGTNYVEVKNDIVFVFVKNARKELAHIASKFFESCFQNVAAVTGTNGKSSTVDIVRQVWTYSGIRAASIGTLGVVTKENSEKLSGHLTSPGAIELHKILNRLSNFGIQDVVMEASSHGIGQYRIGGIKFSVCAFTNLTQEHLDYHKTLENYWAAKSKLFSEFANSKSVFIVNADSDYSEKIYKIAEQKKVKCISYGDKSNDIKIVNINALESHQNVEILFFDRSFSFPLPLQGRFQVYNALCAAAICYYTGMEIELIVEALSRLQPISGRLELVSKFHSANVYIDYAHTPDALKNSILSLREHTKNRMIVLFGCGGNREKQKRKLMGKIAAELSDIVIVTDDNPRDEESSEIRKMILDGCPNAEEIANRKEAIESAMQMLMAGDSLLVAGKGHENYQLIKGESIPFSDKEIILNKVGL